MSPRRLLRLRWLAPMGVAGVVGSAAVAATIHSPSARQQTPTSVLGGQLVKGDENHGGESFVVSGDVSGLAPGVTRPLVLRLSNPNSGDISVHSVLVTVGDSGTGCAGGNLRVGALTRPVFVPGRGEAEISLPVTLAGSALGVCQNATFPLTYGGSAVKA